MKTEAPMLDNSASIRYRGLMTSVLVLFISTLVGCTERSQHNHAVGFQRGDSKHGEYLAKVYGCVECHTVRQVDGIHLDDKLLLAGGKPFPGPNGYLLYSANVTIASQYPEQLLDSDIRGHLASKFEMPTELYNGMAADNMRDLIAYLKTLHPILRPLPNSSIPPGLALPPPTPPIPVPEHEPAVGTVERGAYLARVFTCADCHSPRDPSGAYEPEHLFEGGGMQVPLPDGHLLIAQNLTPDTETGLGAWSDAQIIRAVRNGVTPDGRQLSHMMPYLLVYRDMSDQDAADLVRFLRTLKPVKRSWTSNP
ncbi:cytochrome c [Granulicella sp. L60]|uniref:c-type cytochrome n=1 Tax=Granulicella sp. L60 TaxID=1641866 RepID=UPI00131B64DE|nr:cytochrome c [Granulicella sp. L60]